VPLMPGNEPKNSVSQRPEEGVMSSSGLGEFSAACDKGGNEMVMKVRSRWRSLALVLGFGLLVFTVPAQAASVTPTFVAGGSTCSSVNSAGTSVLTLIAPIGSGTYTGPGGAEFTVTLTNNRGTAFNFSIDGGEVVDVIVKGSGSNWYHYGSPVTADSGLIIPNGNKLNLIHFCYLPGVDFPDSCQVVVSGEGETASATFNRTSGNCTDAKRVTYGVENDVITFIPIGGDPNSTYTGVITFTKDAADPSALILQYDPDGDGVGFSEVPDCVDGTPPGTDTWCVVSAGAVADQGSSNWTITWNVYGEGDPLFK